MQAILFARDEGAGVSDHPSAERVLEGADNVEIEQQGYVMARVSGLKRGVGHYRFFQNHGLLHLFDKELVSMRVFVGERLVWSHSGAMRILQGMPVSAVLGPSWIVLSGQPTLPGDPLPGVRSPVLVDVFDNPGQRPHTEIFQAAKEALGV